MVTLLRRRVVSPATDCEEWHRTLYECIVIPLNSLDASSFGGWCSQPATDVVLVKYPSQQWSLWVWSGYYEPTRTGFSLCSAHLLLRSCPTLGTVRQTEPIGLIGVVFTGWMPFMLPKKKQFQRTEGSSDANHALYVIACGSPAWLVSEGSLYRSRLSDAIVKQLTDARVTVYELSYCTYISFIIKEQFFAMNTSHSLLGYRYRFINRCHYKCTA